MGLNVLGGALEFDAVIQDSQFGATIRRMEQQLGSLTVTAQKEASAIENLVKRAAVGIATFTSFAAATNLVGNIVKVRGEFQQLEVAFETMLGSKVKSDKLLAEITEFAATTPFELKEVANATKQLLAFGIGADRIKDTLRSLGDVASGIGQPLGEIAYLFGTIKTQGVALTQDVRQFAQRGIPIYDELSRVLGVSIEKVGEFITAGKVGFPEIEKAFQGMTAEGSKFGGLMEAQSKTLVGLQSNLSDAVNQMFNDLGKSSEGVFADIIEGTTFVVKNYEKIIDIIKVIAITYGTYRAALVAVNVVERISTAIQLQRALAAKSITTWQALQAAGTVTLQRVTQALNATMLANPYVAVAVAIAGVVSAFVLLADSTTAEERALESLNEQRAQQAQAIDDLKDKTTELVGIINSETSTRFQQVKALKELQARWPGLLDNMDLYSFKALSNEEATKRFNDAIDKSNFSKLEKDFAAAKQGVTALQKEIDNFSAPDETGLIMRGLVDRLTEAKTVANELGADLEKSKQILFEANTPVEQQIAHYEKIKTQLLAQRGQHENNISAMERLGDGAAGFKITMENINLSNVNAQITDITNKVNALKGTGVDVVKDKAFFDKQKKDAQAIIDAVDVNDKNFSKVKTEQTKKIREADEALKKYDTSLKSTNSATAAANKLETERNKLLAERKNLLDTLNDTIKAAEDTRLTDQQRELNSINDKYDELISKVSEYNKKVDEFNRKNPKNAIAKVGQTDVNNLNKGRQIALTNFNLKIDAELFKANLEKKQQLFEQFEEAKKNIGINKARELFANELGQFESFQQLLEQEAKQLAPKVAFGIANVGDATKFRAVLAAIKALNEKQAQEDRDRQAASFTDLLQATKLFKDAELDIHKKYDALETALAKDTTLKNKDDRKKALDEGRQEELIALKNDAIRQSALYKKLNQDIIGFTRDRIKEEVKILENKLKLDGSLTPQMKADIQATIDQYKGLLDSTNQISKDFSKVSATLSSVGSNFHAAADAVEDLNKDLADTLRQLGDMINVAADAAGAVASFASGDIVGGVSSAISAISKIITSFAKVKQSRLEAERQIEEFQARILQGELDHNEILRERQRQQVLLNKLTITGLTDQRRLLLEQRKIAADTATDLLKKLQEESFIAGETTRKKRGSPFLGLIGFFAGTRTEVQQQLQSLAGKSFEEIEKLFNTGQLTDKAKVLFEQLQKLKQEGLDIDALLAENAETFKEALTGTTADNIVNSIAEGFKQGKRSIADFAGTFEDFMRGAIINSLKFKFLEGPLAELFDEFANRTESGDQLTAGEINELKTTFDNIIANASTQFNQLQQIAGVNFNTQSGAGNTLAGAIRGITEQQAELLAGQFGGLRITALQQLNIATQHLQVANNIQSNTALTVARMSEMLKKFDNYETGNRKLHVQF